MCDIHGTSTIKMGSLHCIHTLITMSCDIVIPFPVIGTPCPCSLVGSVVMFPFHVSS